MHYYILDPRSVPPERFEKLQSELQSLLTEFNIVGETGRVTPLRTISDLAETASQRGATTVVACGSDETFTRTVAALKGRDITLGFVPFSDTSYLAAILGLDSVFTAIKTIAARRIERVDLANVGETFFLSYLEFGVLGEDLQNAGWLSSYRILSREPSPLQVRIDGSYTVQMDCLGGLVVNTRSTSCGSEQIGNPTDGYLDLLLLEPLSLTDIVRYSKAIARGCLEQVPKTTVIKCRRVEFLQPENEPVTMFGKVIAKAPVTVEITPHRLKLIVGKKRTF